MKRNQLVVIVLALAVRLVFNLAFHNPLDHATSDMGGYLERARDLLEHPWDKSPNITFFPYGTHFLVFAIDRLFGVDNRVAIGTAYALLGTMTVGFSHAAAERMLDTFGGRTDAAVEGSTAARGRRLSFTVGVALALYPPWIHHGGFVLSETPLSAAIAASTFFAIRLVASGSWRDAAWLGVTFALGIPVRPQLIATAALLLILFAAWRSSKVRLVHGLAIVVPMAAMLFFSAKRLEYHTGELGFVSTNGGFNLAIGRCHPLTLTAAKTKRATYTPVPFSALYHYREKHGFAPLFGLDPAKDTQLSFDGYVWDEKPAYALAKECVATTGAARQLAYSAEHLALLWLYNSPWPTTGITATVFTIIDTAVVLPGLLLGMAIAIRRSRRRLEPRDPALGGVAILSTHVVGLLATAAVFFGEARLRLPYEGIFVTLAAYGYAATWATVVQVYRARRAKSA